ncbi:MAG: exonuclease domain-containing protein [Micrococcales bacterium]
MNDLIFDFSGPTPEWAKRVVVFDTETTGLDLHEARIVTACVAELDEHGEVVSDFPEWLADPGIEIPEIAASVHGVTTEIARANGRDAKSVVSEILEALRGYLEAGIPVIAYNAPYDFTILHYEALRHGLTPLQSPAPIIDPLVLYKHFNKYRKGKRNLEVACQVYNVALDDAHNASADAIASGRVLQSMARAHSRELPSDLHELHQFQAVQSEVQDLDFQKYMRQSKDPSFTVTLGWPLKP